MSGDEIVRTLVLVSALFVFSPARAEDACHKVLEARVQACTQRCIERAKAAVAPEIRDRIKGYGCTNNCMKLEMFNGHSCPGG